VARAFDSTEHPTDLRAGAIASRPHAPGAVGVTAAASEGAPVRVTVAVKAVAWFVYVVWFLHSYRTEGFPFDRERVVAWVGAALLITAIGRPWRRYLQVLLDWFPFLVLFYFYDMSRGIADDLGRPVAVRPLVAIDRALFLGHDPTVMLQRSLYHPNRGVGWWELGVSIVYASHFVVPFVLAGVLWWRSRQLWRQWVSQLMVLSFSGVAVFSLFPTGAPWYAAGRGLLPALAQPVGRGWVKIHLYAAPALLARGRSAANAYAAFPSLHAGYAMLAALFLFRMFGKGRWRWSLFLYPLAMGFVLVYGGEHFVIDVLAGWATAGAVVVIVEASSRWWSRRRPAMRQLPSRTGPLDERPVRDRDLTSAG
jgi:membrane-associated phospholipid phosphatase